MTIFGKQRSTRILRRMAVIVTVAALCGGCSAQGKPQSGFVVPVTPDQISKKSKGPQYRTQQFYERQKGVFDNLPVHLYSVTCLNGEEADNMIHPKGKKWCVYHLFSPSKCVGTVEDAKRVVCEKTETDSTKQRKRQFQTTDWTALLPF